jgi:hypothetical protein
MQLARFTYLALVEGLCLDLPLLLKTVHNILVAPANLVRQTLNHTMIIIQTMQLKD